MNDRSSNRENKTRRCKPIQGIAPISYLNLSMRNKELITSAFEIAVDAHRKSRRNQENALHFSTL